MVGSTILSDRAGEKYIVYTGFQKTELILLVAYLENITYNTDLAERISDAGCVSVGAALTGAAETILTALDSLLQVPKHLRRLIHPRLVSIPARRGEFRDFAIDSLTSVSGRIGATEHSDGS